MNNPYSRKITQIITYSREEAIRLNNDYIGPEHLMLGLIRDGETYAVDVLEHKFRVDLLAFKKQIEGRVRNDDPSYKTTDVSLNEKSANILRLCILEARLMKCGETDAEHLLLAIMKQKDNIVAKMLEDNDVHYDELFSTFSKHAASPEGSLDFQEDEEDEDAPPASRGGLSGGRAKTTDRKVQGSDTPAIDN